MSQELPQKPQDDDEDLLDWRENQARPPGRVLGMDLLLIGISILFTLLLIAVIVLLLHGRRG